VYWDRDVKIEIAEIRMARKSCVCPVSLLRELL